MHCHSFKSHIEYSHLSFSSNTSSFQVSVNKDTLHYFWLHEELKKCKCLFVCLLVRSYVFLVQIFQLSHVSLSFPSALSCFYQFSLSSLLSLCQHTASDRRSLIVYTLSCSTNRSSSLLYLYLYKTKCTVTFSFIT